MTIKISCDESGHTGPDLLDKDQRYFAYASVAIDDDEAWEIINVAKAKYPVQMPELKASKLMKTGLGQALIKDIFQRIDGRFAVNAHEKLVALCGWIFEYIYEPVFQDDPELLYRKNFHRFIAMFSWLWFHDASAEANEAITQFQKYMRSKQAKDAPIFFERIWEPLGDGGKDERPFDLMLRFAAGYRDLIIADNERLEHTTADSGKWILDLSASSLWSHLNHWGQYHEPLEVQCDVSKPLQAIAETFRGDKNDPGAMRARMTGHEGHLGWKFSKPIEFVDSRNHPAVQLADIIAGVAIQLHSNGIPDNFEQVVVAIDANMMRDSIFPDQDIIDLSKRGPMVNYLMLYNLAKKAEVGANPYEGLAETYRFAEDNWARGEAPKL